MIWCAIRSAMEREKISSIAKLAEITGIAPSTLQQTRRRRPQTFILYEIFQLDKVLHFTPAEWEMVMTPQRRAHK